MTNTSMRARRWSTRAATTGDHIPSSSTRRVTRTWELQLRPHGHTQCAAQDTGAVLGLFADEPEQARPT
jgi:hypothetical protein